MLKMIHGRIRDREQWDHGGEEADNYSGESGGRSLKETVTIGRACFPAPFEPGLEYNSPAHGNWNIVHMGMLLPEAHQIYVCAANCNRGVVLTAAEMDAMDRFSFIEIEEEDIYNGEMENLVIDGVGEILKRLEKKPRIILLFTVCLHHFMGVDLTYIYSALREMHPDLFFVDCYMDCIMQKEGLTPDQKLRIKLYDLLEKGEEAVKQINIVGSDFPMRPGSEIMTLLGKEGWKVCDLTTMTTMEEYMRMGESILNLCVYPLGKPGLEILSQRLNIPGLYLPMTWDYEKTDRQLTDLCRSMGLHADKPEDLTAYGIDVASLRSACDESLEKTAKMLKGRRVALDLSATPHALGLARLLLSHGIQVTHIYGDAFLQEEKDSWEWLRRNYPEVVICSVIHHNMRVRPRIPDEGMVAVGQKAAYFHQTPYFVNMVEGEGLHGYDGILTMLSRIQKAAFEQKEIEDTIRKKGIGCPCLLEA